MIGKYLFAIIAVSLLISIFKTFIPTKGVVGSVLRLACGVIMASVLISPFKNLYRADLQSYCSEISSDAESIADIGKEYTKAELSKSIEANLTAYILDKASAMNMDLECQVLLSDDAIPMPKGLKIRGNASPYAKEQFIHTLSHDLGIGEEEIRWH